MGRSSETGLRRKLVKTPGLRWLRRPVVSGEQRQFDLAYVRAGPRSDRPLLVLPGGPGLASVLPYRPLRADATARGMDTIMIEHRGVGLSRTDG
ncbi:hypothetical protein [Saccharopolyspora tripterygii]